MGRAGAIFLGISESTNAAAGDLLWLVDGILCSSDRLSLAGVHDQRVRRFPLRSQRFGFFALCRAAGAANGDLRAACAQRRVRAVAHFSGAVLGAVGIFISTAISLAHRQLASVLRLVHSNR